MRYVAWVLAGLYLIFATVASRPLPRPWKMELCLDPLFTIMLLALWIPAGLFLAVLFIIDWQLGLIILIGHSILIWVVLPALNWLLDG
jgi:hypothetical protein